MCVNSCAESVDDRYPRYVNDLSARGQQQHGKVCTGSRYRNGTKLKEVHAMGQK